MAKDLRTYMAMAGGDRSRGSFLKIANRPRRYLSRAAFQEEEISFGQLYEYYRDKPYMCERINTLQNDLFAMKTMTPYSALDYILSVIGYRDFLREYAAERNVAAADWEEIAAELKEDASAYKTVQEWENHIEEYGRRLEEKRRLSRFGGGSEHAEKEHGVSLMTMHSSKGLEFEVVFIPDVNEGVVPYQKSVDEGNLEEERRLLYVAMTRAREHLHLSFTKQRFHNAVEPSRFLRELTPERGRR